MRRPVSGRVWVAALLLYLLFAPALAWLLAGQTQIEVQLQPRSIEAIVAGTHLQVKPEHWDYSQASRVTLPSPQQLAIAPFDQSIYWQPSRGGVAGVVGWLGDWAQAIRPPSAWSGLVSRGSNTATYSLKAGRSVALLPLTGANGEGLVLLVQPEKGFLAWYTWKDGRPDRQLERTSFNPGGRVSLGDFLAEIVLVVWAGAFLACIALLVGQLARRFGLSSKSPSDLPSTGETTRTVPARAGSPARFVRPLTRPYVLPLAFFFIGTLLYAVVGVVVLEGIPHVQDEVAYLFQAKTFALARSYVPVPPEPQAWQSGFMLAYNGRWFSKYPPGYPLMLVPGVLAGLPWLINPLAGGASLALVYATGRRLFGTRAALWAGLLGLLSPWVIFMSGSYMSHPTTMMWIALFLYCLVRTNPRPGEHEPEVPPRGKRGWALLAGFAIGMAFISREWTALGIGVGAAVWALGDIVLARLPLKRLSSYAIIIAGFLPPLLVLLYENRSLTGDWLRLAQDLFESYDQPGFGPGHGPGAGHTLGIATYNALVYLRSLSTLFNGWPAPFSLAPLALGLGAAALSTGQRRLKWDLLLWLCALGLFGAYFLWWSSTTIYGPRYWYEAMPFLLLLAGRGLDWLGVVAHGRSGHAPSSRLRWAVPSALVALLTTYTLTQALPWQVEFHSGYNDIDSSSLRHVEEARLPRSIVFVALDPARFNRDYDKVFFANDPLLEGHIIYARDLGSDENRIVAQYFADREPYWLPLGGSPQPGFGPAP